MTFTATRYLGNYYYYFTADYINWTVMVSRYWLSCLDINLVRCCRKINVLECANAIPGDGGQGSQTVFVCAGQTISCLETARQFPQMVRKDNLKTSWTASTHREGGFVWNCMLPYLSYYFCSMRWEEITGGSATGGPEAKSGHSLNFMILIKHWTSEHFLCKTHWRV